MRHSRFMAIGALLVCLILPAAPAAGSSDNHTDSPRSFEASFVSLKRGHSIAPARIDLCDNATLVVSIHNEPLRDARGRYALAGIQFDADYAFMLRRLPRFRYTLTLKGIVLFNTYMFGTATLKEFLDGDRLTQEIPFLFFATAASAPRERQTRTRPLFK